MNASLKAILGAAGVALFLGLSAPAQADSVAEFYSGKQLKVVIRAATGGSYDAYSRLLARYLVRHLPGNPTIVPVNMPGGGGLKALEYVAKVAPKDGTVITMVSQPFPMDQALGLNKALDTDLRTLNWIGNMSEQMQMLYTSPRSSTRSLEDARRRETVIGATGTGATSTQLMALYNNALGTNFKIIYGYPGGGNSPGRRARRAGRAQHDRATAAFQDAGRNHRRAEFFDPDRADEASGV